MFASTFRWLQRKRYQYEVTFSLYMLTSTEKFIFNSFIFLFFSMILIACSLYLPQHIAWVTNRAWFYYHGDENSKIVSEQDPMKQMTEAMLDRVTGNVGSLLAETARVTLAAGAVKGEL